MRFVLDKDDPKVPDLAELIAFAGGAVVPRGEAAFCMICAHDLALSRYVARVVVAPARS